MSELEVIAAAEAALDDALKETVRRHPLAECESCPLYPNGKYVPTDGPSKAKLAVVGEAPGANEARVGKPFIGDSGKLLNTVLKHYDIDGKAIIKTNAALCREPNGATPPAAALRACRPRLLGELRDREVQDVVALGNSACQSLLATKTGVTSLRVGYGLTNEEELPGVRILPTFHPAAALRQPDFFPSIVTDFGKLKGHFTSWYEPKWKAYETPEEALVALDQLLAYPSDHLTIDIESNIEKDVSFEDPRRHLLLCVGIGFAPGRVAVIGYQACQDERVLDKMLKLFQLRRLFCQNGKFDLKGLWAKLKFQLLTLAGDSMLAHYCIDERSGIHALDYMAVEMLGAPNWKHALDPWEPRKNGYKAIPRLVLYKYNAMDVHATDMLLDLLLKQLDEYDSERNEPIRRRADGQVWGLRQLHDFLCKASDQLMVVELNGIGVDLKYNDELAVQYTASLGLLESAIAGAIPDPKWGDFNPRSPIQVKKVVKEVFHLRLPMTMNQRKEYVETTNKEALQGLLERNLGKPSEEFFRRMLEHRKESKAYGTYVKGIRKRTYRGRLYTTFLLHRTSSGRLSSRNPNLQNITRGSVIRKQFVPCINGNVFVEGDFGQAELRVLCWLAQDEYLREVFNDPTRDLFDELTPRLYGNVSGLDDAALKELRIRVKAYVYGLSYGREAHSIAAEYKIPVPEAERGMREFFKVIPTTVEFREMVRRRVLQGEDLVTPFGRHRRFWLITNSNKKDVMNEALAFLPQSTASDICVNGAISLRPKLKGIGYMRNIVHDSILTECPPDRVQEVAHLMNESMLESARQVVGDYVKFKVDISSGPSWGELAKLPAVA